MGTQIFRALLANPPLRLQVEPSQSRLVTGIGQEGRWLTKRPEHVQASPLVGRQVAIENADNGANRQVRRGVRGGGQVIDGMRECRGENTWAGDLAWTGRRQ